MLDERASQFHRLICPHSTVRDLRNVFHLGVKKNTYDWLTSPIRPFYCRMILWKLHSEGFKQLFNANLSIAVCDPSNALTAHLAGSSKYEYVWSICQLISSPDDDYDYRKKTTSDTSSTSVLNWCVKFFNRMFIVNLLFIFISVVVK